MKHKIAMIGFGGMANWHFRLLKDIDDLDLAGIWDIKEAAREDAKSKGVHVYGSLEELLADPETDLVLVATPNDIHKEMAVKAMEAGKNVVSEKPVTLCSADLQEMIAASEHTGKLFTVHQNRRWDEDFLTVKNILNESKLGGVFRIESRVQGSHGIPGDWRGEKKHGGGMVLDWGVHLLDQACQMFPGAKIKKVYGRLDNITNQEVDDGFYADLLFDNGVRYIVEVGTSNFVTLPRWYVLGFNGTVQFGWDMEGDFVCANGVEEGEVKPVVTAAGLTKTMAPRNRDTVEDVEIPKASSDIKDYYKNVMATIEGREEIIVKLPEVARVMRLMETIFESAQKCQVIDFE